MKAQVATGFASVRRAAYYKQATPYEGFKIGRPSFEVYGNYGVSLQRVETNVRHGKRGSVGLSSTMLSGWRILFSAAADDPF
jgi:hypothetical protein